MPVSNAKSRRLLARLTLAALPLVAAASQADAQWFPPMGGVPSPHELVQWFPPIGAASPREIAERLRAEGFFLIGPLRRNDTVYLADVNGGPAGRERLVIDAWSGEVLQRFVGRSPYSRPGADGYVMERGEFDSPPPLAPPPARDFVTGPGGNANLAYGGPANARIPDAVGPISPIERAPRTKVKPKPTAGKPAPTPTKPATAALPPTTPAKPEEGGATPAAKDNSGGAAATPSPAAPPVTPPPAPEASQPPSAPPKPDASPAGSSPSAAPDQTKEATPNPEGAATPPSMPQTQAKEEPRPAQPPSAVPSAAATTKPGEKSKVNDVPVNPLE